jgi:hypothetical protein
MNSLDVPDSHRYLVTCATLALSTLNDDGSIQTTAIWVLLDDDGLLRTSLATNRRKYHNLADRPKVTRFAISPSDPLHTLEVRAKAEIINDDPDHQPDGQTDRHLRLRTDPRQHGRASDPRPGRRHIASHPGPGTGIAPLLPTAAGNARCDPWRAVALASRLIGAARVAVSRFAERGYESVGADGAPENRSSRGVVVGSVGEVLFEFGAEFVGRG